MAVTIYPKQLVEHDGKVQKFEPFKLEKDGKLSPIVAASISSSLQAITQVLNGKLCFGPCSDGAVLGNHDAQVREVYFKTANAEVEIPHGLGRIVVGYWPIRWSKAARVYDSSAGSWNDAWLFLKCDTAATLVKLVLF